MSKWIRPLCSPRRSTTGRSGGVHSLRSAFQTEFLVCHSATLRGFKMAAKTQSTLLGEHMAGNTRKLNNYPHRVYCIFGFSRLHDRQFGNNCDRNSGFVSHNLRINSRVRFAASLNTKRQPDVKCTDVNNADRRSTRSHTARKYIASTCRRWRHSPQRQRGDIYFRTANLVRLAVER